MNPAQARAGRGAPAREPMAVPGRCGLYQRIVVPVDGSTLAAEMIPVAAALAARHATPLALLRIVSHASARAAAARETAALAARFATESLCVVDAGDVAAAILREAARVPGTLIALSSHGHLGVLEAVLGNVALRVVRAGHGPVLVYRPRGGRDADPLPRRISRVVLPLDGSGVSEAMAEEAAQLATWLGVRLVVVSVADARASAAVRSAAGAAAESSFARGRARELARAWGVEPGWEVLHGEPAAAIADFVQEDPGTVLAMATRGRGALTSALLGSVTAACLRRAGVPVFVRAATEAVG